MAKMTPKVREGVIGALQTERGERVFVPVRREDLNKKERIGGEGEFTQITPDMLCFISEAVQRGDNILGQGFREVYLTTFLRGAHFEFGLKIEKKQLLSDPKALGRVDQIRKSEEVIFLVKIIAQVVLTDDQVNELEEKSPKIEVVSPDKLASFLRSHKKRIRPSSLLAARQIAGIAQ